jgi:AraC-like DNA-binding protein
VSTRNRRSAGEFRSASRHADRKRYEQIIEKYLSDCYAQRTVARVSELAQLLDANRPYLSRIIPQLFGKSLREILRERQFDEAKRLLRVTPLGLDDIASASAFGHRSTFFRLFRAAFGITPAEYREKATNCDFTKD